MKRRQLTDRGGHGGRMFHETVDRLVDQIQDQDRLRLLEPTSLPKVLRGYRRRARPQTAIISRAAKGACERRIAAEADTAATERVTARFIRSKERMLDRLAQKLRFRP